MFDSERQSLYFDICSLASLVFAAWQLAGRADSGAATAEPVGSHTSGVGVTSPSGALG